MKVAMYLSDTMELLGVVEVERDIAEQLKHGGYWKCANYEPMLAPTSGRVAFDALYNVIEYKAEAIYGSKGQTIILKCEKREHLELWPKQLWPRRRKKGWKLPKADRRQRAQQQGPQYRLINPNAFRHG